jgi:hypothetical protein
MPAGQSQPSRTGLHRRRCCSGGRCYSACRTSRGYHPAAWTATVDLDTCTLAASLRQVLDVAAERVPVRVLAALRGQ